LNTSKSRLKIPGVENWEAD